MRSCRPRRKNVSIMTGCISLQDDNGLEALLHPSVHLGVCVVKRNPEPNFCEDVEEFVCVGGSCQECILMAERVQDNKALSGKSVRGQPCTRTAPQRHRGLWGRSPCFPRECQIQITVPLKTRKILESRR